MTRFDRVERNVVVNQVWPIEVIDDLQQKDDDMFGYFFCSWFLSF